MGQGRAAMAGQSSPDVAGSSPNLRACRSGKEFTGSGEIQRVMTGEVKQMRVLYGLSTIFGLAAIESTVRKLVWWLQVPAGKGRIDNPNSGLSIGSNGVVFATWSFMAYCGSKMVMYHDATGGTIFIVGAAIAIGGL
ncbi:ABC transporter B family member 15-like protein [Corchorus olitorius]|uniref:ABC transporter B family member 15-like protein n=1 Tax=Corchorus olitorius TaxID=93759 RepID=A0A1R3KYR6_9ROSI|nr:ABC transporter B family member 15-like protein [Corchorus olitorius]